ncbi:MAG: amidase [Corynebacterium sp.]|uniref:amidase n=1 Tax=Corynebacterium sp. TaxID=1720 RepID=UPI0026DFB67B|nr:amidase [Corynebacterium sp.]MDO5669447.1 amidase [Corynebacterium sp.]
MSDLLSLSALEVGRAIDAGDVTPTELVDAQLQRIGTLDGEIGAYISVRYDAARAEAARLTEELAAGHSRGPLHGVPVALKDSIYLAGEVTTLGSQTHRDYIAPYDATVVTQLREAGCVILGKLHMNEYAWGITGENPWFGPVRNPVVPGTLAGGSSGGSAAAVAADLAFATLGADAAGSIRLPSAVCGGVGLKPTHGLVSTRGDVALAPTVGCIGPMTADVADNAAVLAALTGRTYRLEAGPLTYGVASWFLDGVDRQVLAVFDGALEGKAVRELNLPALQDAPWATSTIALAEASAIHHRTLQERAEDISLPVRLNLQLGEAIAAVDYLEARRVREIIRAELDRALETVDVLLAPTLPSPGLSPRGDLTRLLVPANLTGHPALTVPIGVVDGQPVGLQIIGRHHDEETVYRAGQALTAPGNSKACLRPPAR